MTFLIVFYTHKRKEQLYSMAQTNDFQLCQQYLLNYIENIKQQMEQYQIELTKQSESYPITSISLIQIDHCLKEFVNCQRKYLSIRNNNQLIKFKDHIQEKELFEIINAFHLTIDQVCINIDF